MTTPPGEAPKAALWARVSTTDQTNEGQLYELREWAANRGLDVVAEFVTEDSAWAQAHNGNGNGGKGSEFDAKRTELLDGARMGHYQIVLCWGLDRLSRRGAEDMLGFVRRLTDTGCRLWASKDPWVESMTDPMIRELLLSVFATLARFESERRSARIKTGMDRRKRAGLPVGGRVEGARDRKPRRTEGYLETWARRKAAEPVPDWLPEAQALYDDLDPTTGRPAWTVEAIGQQAGVTAKVVKRWLNHGGPGGKARERRRKAS
jgi:DNA invertase Pin-like site-specific DNA recombinase